MDLDALVDSVAPGLRTLPQTVSHVREVFDTGDLRALADPSRVDAYVPLVVLGIVAYLLVCLLARRVRLALTPAPAKPGKQDEDVARATNTPLWHRVWWRIRRPTDLMRVDGLAVNRTRKPHCAWLGPTGAGKSASVATVRVDGRRPTLIVTPDISDPLRAAALRTGRCVLWTACETGQSINFLLGTPQEVAERLTEVFRSGGTGAWKRAARMNAAAVVQQIDDDGLPRDLQTIGERLRERVRQDKQLALVCAGWVDRFLDMADQFGSSIAPGGVDVADLLAQGYTVLMDNDAFEHPGLVEDIVSLGLAEAKRCAARVPGGFRLIFEEAGQLGERIELAAPFFRAGRRRKIMVDVLTQAESDLQYKGSDAITANLGTRVYFAQELKSLQRVAADRLGIDHEKLDPANMRDFTAWVAHGRIRRLVRFPKPPSLPANVHVREVPKTQPSTEARISVTYSEDASTEQADTGRAGVAEAGLVYGPVAMPRLYGEAPVAEKLRPQLVNIWTRHVFPRGMNGCYESTYRRNNSGRPGCSFGGADWTTYVLVKCLEDARCEGVTEDALPGYLSNIQRQTAAGELTVDHSCENEVCDRVEHLSWQSRSRNSELYHERKRKQRELQSV